MTNERLVAISYVLFTLIIAVFLGEVLGGLFASFGATAFLNRAVFGEETTWANVIGFVVAVGIAVATWANAQTRALSIDIAAELRKVTWPSWPETRAATLAVIVASFIAAGILGTMDVVFRWVSGKLYGAL
jgi:preprotein translocase subunit SecE